MKKRKIGIFLLSASMLLGAGATMISCENQNEQEEVKNIESVTIENLDETTVLDGSIINLKANVKPIDSNKEFNKKVNWSSSDESVATVKNGAVTLKKVIEPKTVTITATSVEDDTKSGSVTLDVRHSPIDLYASKGNELDTSMFLEDGSMSATPGDVALISADAYGTKFYFESEITIDTIAETENYPKVGIMIGDNPDGNWVGQGDGIQTLFFYLDAIKGNLGAGVNTYGVCVSDESGATWNWGVKPISDFRAGKTIKTNVSFKMGILRNGNQYIVYVENAETGAMEPQKSFTWDGIDADKDAYVWVGGFNTGITCKGFRGVKDDIDSYFKAPTSIKLNADQTLYVGDSYRSEYTLDSQTYDASKLVWESSDPTVATVDQTGLVTATDKVGVTTISLKYGEVVGSYKVTTTDDVAVKIVLDGKRDDAVWEIAKTKPIYLTRNNNNYEDFYAVKTSRGILLGADLYTTVQHSGENWWTGDNFELKFGVDDVLVDKQFWWSSCGGTSNIKDSYVTSYSEERGMYKISFESIIPFSSLGDNVTKESKIAIMGTLGANPGGSGWHQVSGINAEITEEGFKDQTTHDCTGGHTYGNQIVITPATCEGDGTAIEYCRYCGESHEVTLPKGAHAKVEGTEQVVEEPTETTFGIYSAECSICHERFEYEGTRGTNILKEPIVHDHLAGGWKNPDTWAKMFVEEGDFKYEVKAHMEGGGGKDNDNFQAGDNCWKTLLPIIYSLKDDGTTIVNPTVFRMDWFGWMDDALTDEDNDGEKLAESQDTGNVWCDWANEIATVVKDCEVTFRFERTGNELVITTTVYSNTYEKQFEPLIQKLHGIKHAQIGVAFSSEFTQATINELYRVK